MAGRGRGAVLPAWMTAAGAKPTAPGAPVAASPQRPAAQSSGLAANQPRPAALPQATGPKPAAPATVEWTEHTAPDGRKYFYNKRTGTSSWVRPPELASSPTARAPQVAAAPAATRPAAVTPAPAAAAAAAPAAEPKPATPWKEFTAPDGRKYYYNHVSKESRWTMPEELKASLTPAAAVAAAPAATRAAPAAAPASYAPPAVRPAAVGTVAPARASPARLSPSPAPVRAAAAAAARGHSSRASATPARGFVVPPGVLETGPPREYADAAEAKAAFRSLLTAAGVDSGVSWEDVARAVSGDARFGALRTAGERRAAFNEHVAARRKEEAEAARRRRLAAKEGFLALLDASEELGRATDEAAAAGLPPPKFSRARDLLELEPRWQDVDGDSERTELFEDWVADRARVRRERERAERRERGRAFAELLRRTPTITAGTSWRRAQEELRDAPELDGLDRGDALAAFEDHVRALEAEEREAEARRRAERRAAERDNRDAFRDQLTALRAKGAITAATRWRDLVDGPLDGDATYEAVLGNTSGSRPKELFLDVLEELEDEYAAQRPALKDAIARLLSEGGRGGGKGTEGAGSDALSAATEKRGEDAPATEAALAGKGEGADAQAGETGDAGVKTATSTTADGPAPAAAPTGLRALEEPAAATPEVFLAALEEVPTSTASVATRRAFHTEAVTRAAEEAERKERALARAREDLADALRDAGVKHDTTWEEAKGLGEGSVEWAELPDDTQRRQAYDELVARLGERRRRERSSSRRQRSASPGGRSDGSGDEDGSRRRRHRHGRSERDRRGARRSRHDSDDERRGGKRRKGRRSPSASRSRSPEEGERQDW